MRIGIFGGSFNPVHSEHISLCQYILDTMKLDKLIVIPNAIPPHKNTCSISFYHRFKMLELSSLAKMSKVTFSKIEADESICHYSFDTLTKLNNLYPNDELFFCMGQDSLNYLDKWHKGIELINLANLVVVGRKDYDCSLANTKVKEFLTHYLKTEKDINNLALNAKSEHYCYLLEKVFDSVSSTKIRAEFNKLYQQEPKPILSFVLQHSSRYPNIVKHLETTVIEYILDNHIYA